MAAFTVDEVVVITGASSGIGAGTAVKFVERGATRFCLTGRQLDALNETKAACIAASSGKLTDDKFNIVVGELTNDSVRDKIVNSTIDKFGRIDVLVNSAGILSSGPFETASLEDFDSLMDINVRSLVGIAQLCIPHLKKTKGSIVNVSSVNGIRSFANVGYYCMSKAAVDMFTKCLALELAEDGVRVNAVNPGVVYTNVHKRAGMSEEQYAQFLERTKTTHPLGRHGEVEEVANAIVFLASKEASFMTGNLTPIDGGRNCVCPR